jgi:hypothetical protein
MTWRRGAEMATDGPDPTPCDQEIFQKGRHVGMLAGPGSNAIERWVRGVAERSGQRVDWHFFGGRANVLCIGDIDAARREFDASIPALQAAFRGLVWR